MLINDKDRYVGRSLEAYGEFSRGEVNFFAHVIKPGMVVCDVGANIGAHTIHFGRLVGPTGRVAAFEPQRLLFQMLCANVALANLNNVFCYQLAVGKQQENIKIGEADPEAEMNFGGIDLRSLQSVGGEEPLEIVPLQFPCHVMKVDVEGMECEVLEGAADMIRLYRPLLFVENDRVDRSEELIRLVRRLGYTPRWFLTPLYFEDSWSGKKENIWGQQAVSANMVCCPDSDMFVNLDEATQANYIEYQKEKFDGTQPPA
jgi:FkbM family methyltransferase